ERAQRRDLAENGRRLARRRRGAEKAAQVAGVQLARVRAELLAGDERLERTDIAHVRAHGARRGAPLAGQVSLEHRDLVSQRHGRERTDLAKPGPVREPEPGSAEA